MVAFGMSRSTRLFEIIQILRHAKAPMTAQAIAESLEVAKRTVYRDMAVLQAMRLPIEGEAGVGYVMRAGFDLPPLMFTPEETEAIIVGLALLGRTGDRGLEQAAERAASKISDVLPGDAQTPASLHVSKWNRIPESRVAVRNLRHFIREDAELEIAYVDLKGRRTNRTIRPLALIYYIEAVVVAAWCDLRHGFRHFRVERIDECRPTGNCFSESATRLREAWQRETGM